MTKGASGAVDLAACRRQRVKGGPHCLCEPVCAVCGYGPHMAAHAPADGEDLDAPPCRHEYAP